MTPEKPDLNRPEPIYVWHCCGALGHTIPWSEWMAGDIWPIGIGEDFSKTSVYLYSQLGQLGDTERAQWVHSQTQRIGCPSLCADFYFDWITMRIAWNLVRQEIERMCRE